MTPLDPMTDVAEPVAPGLLRILAPNPSPYTFTGTMSYVLGERSVAVIDPGPADPSHLASLESAIAGRPVEAIVVTHNHRDHSPAARPLAERTGAPIVGAAPLNPPGLDGSVDASFDALYAPDRVLVDGERLEGEGWTLEPVATPGHTSNHLCFAWAQGDALFSGDHVMGWSTSVVIPPDGDMGDYMASLTKLTGRGEATYWPGHGPAVADPQRLLRGMIGHRRQRERQIQRTLEPGPLAIPPMVAAMYKGLDERLVPAAQLSVLAHCLDLERRGLVGHMGDHWILEPAR